MGYTRISRYAEPDAILSSIPDIIYRLDAAGRVLFVNDSIKKYGYNPDALLGQPIINIVYPQDRRIVRRKINERRTGARVGTFDVRFLTGGAKSSHFDVFNVSAEGLYNSKKPKKTSFQGTQGIARYITDRKIAEEGRVKKEKYKAVLEVAGAVCHELNQPMQSILGYSEILLMDTAVDDSTREKIYKIRRQIIRMGEITSKLMGISQYKTKKYLKTKIIDLEYDSSGCNGLQDDSNDKTR